MKLTKIFYGNQYVTGFFCTGRAPREYTLMQKVGFYITKWLMITAKVCVIAWMIVGGMFYGKYTNPKLVFADREIVVEKETKAPIMDKIADCESGIRKSDGSAIKGSAKHIDPKTGQVYTKANTNKTVDIGKYMVNEFYHGKSATKLGYDLTKEEDNEKMAYYIYHTQGTGPWSASESCWNR